MQDEEIEDAGNGIYPDLPGQHLTSQLSQLFRLLIHQPATSNIPSEHIQQGPGTQNFPPSNAGDTGGLNATDPTLHPDRNQFTHPQEESRPVPSLSGTREAEVAGRQPELADALPYSTTPWTYDSSYNSSGPGSLSRDHTLARGWHATQDYEATAVSYTNSTLVGSSHDPLFVQRKRKDRQNGVVSYPAEENFGIFPDPPHKLRRTDEHPVHNIDANHRTNIQGADSRPEGNGRSRHPKNMIQPLPPPPPPPPSGLHSELPSQASIIGPDTLLPQDHPDPAHTIQGYSVPHDSRRVMPVKPPSMRASPGVVEHSFVKDTSAPEALYTNAAFGPPYPTRPMASFEQIPGPGGSFNGYPSTAHPHPHISATHNHAPFQNPPFTSNVPGPPINPTNQLAGPTDRTTPRDQLPPDPPYPDAFAYHSSFPHSGGGSFGNSW